MDNCCFLPVSLEPGALACSPAVSFGKGQTGGKLPRDTHPSDRDFGDKDRERKKKPFIIFITAQSPEGYEAAEAP